jgi:hypothetical protein
MKIPESKRSKIGIIVEFRRIPNRLPNLVFFQAFFTHKHDTLLLT